MKPRDFFFKDAHLIFNFARETLAETWPWSAPGNELRCGFQVRVQSNNRVNDSTVSNVLTRAVPSLPRRSVTGQAAETDCNEFASDTQDFQACPFKIQVRGIILQFGCWRQETFSLGDLKWGSGDCTII